MDFLWRRVSEAEKASIKKEAKRIMDGFALKLKKVRLPETEGVKRSSQLREETAASSDPEFRKAFFENAPSKEGDWIKAEKGTWK